MGTKPFSGLKETVVKHRQPSFLLIGPLSGHGNELFLRKAEIMCTRTITALVASFVLALGSLSAGPVRAQVVTAGPVAQDLATNPIGKVVTATGSVKIERANAMVVLANVAGQAGQATVGDLVYLGDVVATGADGRVSINFTDGSSFNLSNNARMALDKFVYDPNGTSNSTLFNVTNGTLTFVAGKIAKTGDMKVGTPVATMGIRGTTPHVEILGDGTVRFATLLEEGKSKLTKKPVAPASQPEEKSHPKLNICRGC